MGFPGGSAVKNTPSNVGDAGSIPELGRYPGEENGNPLQYSCLGNPMDRGAQQATVHEAAELDTIEMTQQAQKIQKSPEEKDRIMPCVYT